MRLLALMTLLVATGCVQTTVETKYHCEFVYMEPEDYDVISPFGITELYKHNRTCEELKKSPL